MILFIHHIQIIQNPFSTYHGNSYTLTEIFHTEDFYHSDLSCMGHMSSAAGAEICPRKTYKADFPCQFFFTSVRQSRKLLFIRIKNFYRIILPYVSVCFFFDLRQLFLIKNTAEINGDHIAAHMKTNIIVSICFMHKTAYYVLP